LEAAAEAELVRVDRVASDLVSAERCRDAPVGPAQVFVTQVFVVQASFARSLVAEAAENLPAVLALWAAAVFQAHLLLWLVDATVGLFVR
jgi:hypothetical protein